MGTGVQLPCRTAIYVMNLFKKVVWYASSGEARRRGSDSPHYQEYECQMYCILLAQNYIKRVGEDLCTSGTSLKVESLTSAVFRGFRVKMCLCRSSYPVAYPDPSWRPRQDI